MSIYESLAQFVLGVGAGSGVCVYLSRVVLDKHEERHKAHETKIGILEARVNACESRLAALYSAHDERGTVCRKTTKRSTKTRLKKR